VRAVSCNEPSGRPFATGAETPSLDGGSEGLDGADFRPSITADSSATIPPKRFGKFCPPLAQGFRMLHPGLTPLRRDSSPK
jgi:hypothetical protein